MFYVYEYRNPTTNIPFYVGKGQGDRMYQHLWNLKNHHNSTLVSIIQDLNMKDQRPLIDKVFISEYEEQAYDEERRLILLYGRLDLNTGTLANRTHGGEGFGQTGTKWSPILRIKHELRILQNPRGRAIDQYSLDGKIIQSYAAPIYMRNVGFTSGAIKDIRLCCQGHRFSANGYRWAFMGEPLSTTAKKGILVEQRDINNQTIRTFVSIGLAAKATGINAGDIATCVRGERCTAGGYIWIDVYAPKIKQDFKSKGVNQLTLDGTFVQLHKSISEAANAIGIDGTNISNVCKGRRKTAGGFKWKYAG